MNAALPGSTIQIQAGAYHEQVSISGKNNSTSASESDRIVIEADPQSLPGSVVITEASQVCTNGFAIQLQQSKFITIRALTISGTGGQAISLLGGINQNQSIHIERNRIFNNGSSECNGGITIARGNPDTLIVNNLIYANGRNGITFIDADGGPHYVVENTIHANQRSGVNVARSHVVYLVNNAITQNDTAAGSTGGRFGVSREASTAPQPQGITLLNNLICGNRLGEINGPALDATDSGNLTPQGTEGAGVSASPGCEILANVYANLNGPDSLPNTADNDFTLASHSPAIDRRMDPRTLGLSILFNKNPDGCFTRTLKDGTKVNFDSQGLQSFVIDRNGNTTNYSYDAQGRLISIIDPAGLVTNFTYSGSRLASITDPAGRITSLQHDAQGNLHQVTFPGGSQRSFGYDNRHLMTSETDERGFTTQRQYDKLGKFTGATKKDGTLISATNIQSVGFVDPASGLGSKTNPAPVVRPSQALSTLTDGRNDTTSFETDRFGATTRQVDALGQTMLIQRDANANPTRITRPNGAVTTMTYDARGNLLTSTDPIGAKTTFTYEPNFNQVTSIKDSKSNTTTINYDLKGNLIEIIDALGNRTQMTYDTRGLLNSVTSAVGTPQQNTTSFTYDARGNLLTTTDPLGNITTLEYDSAGNVIRSTDGEGRITEFTYDAMNRLASVRDPNLQITSYAYDPTGNLTQVVDAKNQITTFAYDEMDRLASATNPLGLTETFAYDANGNLTSTINRNGQTATFDYDALNRLTKKTRPPTSTEVGPQVTNFSYDSVGNLVAVVNPVIGVFNQYDLANRLISSTSSTEEAVAGTVTTINQDTLIDANNFQFDGRTLQVNAKTLTVNGSHTFANLILVNGAVLTHSPTTANKTGELDIRVTGALTVDATSKIDVTARGFLGGNQSGNPVGGRGITVGFVVGSSGRSGGSYGGLGGSLNGSSNSVYGDFKDPNDPGSGGASDASRRAGNGGGLIRIVAQTLQLDGVIRADGGVSPDDCCAGGGSGGGIRIDVGTLRGTGTIGANGGNGIASSGGGGGGRGRVAVYYQDATTFNFTTQVTAFGGTGNGAPNGQDGTVFLQQQTFIGWAPLEYNAPVMLALSEVRSEFSRRVEGLAEAQENKAVQLASLGAIPLGLKADAGPVRIPDFKELIAKIHAEMPQVPQRRVYEPVPVVARRKTREPLLGSGCREETIAYCPEPVEGPIAFCCRSHLHLRPQRQPHLHDRPDRYHHLRL